MQEYNSSIHSTTKNKPLATFFGNRIFTDPQHLEEQRNEITRLLRKKQEQDLAYHNSKRTEPKDYSPGDIIYPKINKRIASKLTKKFRKEIVSENNRTTVKTISGHVIHKSLIKT